MKLPSLSLCKNSPFWLIILFSSLAFWLLFHSKYLRIVLGGVSESQWVLQVCCYLFTFYLSSNLIGFIFSQYWDCERMFWFCDYECEPWDWTKYVGICCRGGNVTITSGYVLRAYQAIQSLSRLHSYFRLYLENFVPFFLNIFSIIFYFT